MNLFISTVLLAVFANHAPLSSAKIHSRLHLNKETVPPISKEHTLDSRPSQFETVQENRPKNSDLVSTLSEIQTRTANYLGNNFYSHSHRNNLHLNQPRVANPQPIHCVDENNRPVDWIIFYKLPRVHGSPNPLIVNGEAYMYVSSEDVKRFEKEKDNTKEKGNEKQDEVKDKTEVEQNVNEVVLKDVDKAEILNNILQSNESDFQKSYDNEIKNGKENVKSNMETVKNVESNGKKSLEELNNIDVRRELYPYYSYANDDVGSDEQKILMDKLKLFLMKQFVSDAREQIDMEKPHARDVEIENRAKLLKSELDGTREKRDTDNVMQYTESVQMESVDYPWNKEREDMYKDTDFEKNGESLVKSETKDSSRLELDFSDSIRVLDNLLKARTSRDNINAVRTPKFDARNGKLNREDFFELFRAIELLNDNSENDYSEETVGYDSSDEVDQAIGDASYLKYFQDDLTPNKSIEQNRKNTERTVYKNSYVNYPQDIPTSDGATHKGDIGNSNLTEKQNLKNAARTKTGDEKIAESQSAGDVTPHWTVSKYSVRDPSSLPGKIVSPFLFNTSYNTEFSLDGVKILYNDQTPTSTTVQFGHSKGLVLGNSEGGMWIVHSVPHFVDDAQASYSYPHTGLMYGQNFLCLSLNRTELNEVGNNLGHNQVYKYSTHISASNRDLYPTLASVIDGTYTSGDNYYRGTIHTRFGSVPFKTFAKSRELGEDLYANIARDLATSLLVETWPNGPGRLRSNCKQRDRLVENVEGINASVVAFASTHDHAKWTISFRSELGKSREGVGNSYVGKDSLVETSDGQVDPLKMNTDDSDVSNRSVEEAVQNSRYDANQLSNELDPLPQSSTESGDDLDTSDAEAGASSDSSMGEMELIAHRLFNRKYDLDGNMNNLDTMDDSAKETEEDDSARETDEDESTPCIGSMEDLVAKAVGNVNVERRRRSVGKKDRVDVSDLTGELEEFNYPLGDRVRKFPGQVGTFSNNNGQTLNSNVQNSVPSEKTLDSTVETLVSNVKSVDSTTSTDIPGKTTGVQDSGHFVCNGDINRAEDQLKRGGGSVCVDSEVLWGLYHSLVTSVEPCQ